MNVFIFIEVLALVFAGLAAAKTPEPPHLSFGWGSVFLLILVLIFGGIRF